MDCQPDWDDMIDATNIGVDLFQKWVSPPIPIFDFRHFSGIM